MTRPPPAPTLSPSATLFRSAAADTVTGATRGLSLIGGGAGNITVTGTGLFGGTGDAASMFDNGSGTVTVDISGASGTTGGNGIVVCDRATGGDINLTTGGGP